MYVFTYIHLDSIVEVLLDRACNFSSGETLERTLKLSKYVSSFSDWRLKAAALLKVNTLFYFWHKVDDGDVIYDNWLHRGMFLFAGWGSGSSRECRVGRIRQ